MENDIILRFQMTPNHDAFPFFLKKYPEALNIVNEPASKNELENANRIREKFYLKEGHGAYMTDIVRAFRLARGAECYIEVGTRDKGNIAWLSTLLSPTAQIIDVDLEQISEAQDRLINYLPSGFRYSAIEGDSIGFETINSVHKTLQGSLADIIFLDSNHMYSHFAKELSLYWQFLKPGGILLIHDVFWEGNDTEKGKAQAADRIDRYLPVYVVSMNNPLSRFYFQPGHKDSWGGVGIIIKDDNHNII